MSSTIHLTRKSRPTNPNARNQQGVISTGTAYTTNYEEDDYVYPMGQRMNKAFKRKRATKSDYTQECIVYKVQNCNSCPLRGLRHKGNRKIESNHKLEYHKDILRQRLSREKGHEKRKIRAADLEPIFGHIKSNRNFKPFTLKGIKKAEFEFG